eukprot:CAMPEP_0201641442 /NCGR_PEP_ID=MMETSP0493-20130528/24106_1 /ASSEMBLY_ACC=CAM_ASM_000838 /TAXON_ID=420259 /ORGANISM="Thalassiosira gravida, Strain GMp14c1" /LENGTH=129 /DNA_ID=CAMNT_0048115357 /DNA_START=77 /DNA_END=466 /DNA_ORIENTATION=-
MENFLFSFFFVACPPPHFNTDLAALSLYSFFLFDSSLAVAGSVIEEDVDFLLRTPLSVNSTSAAGTVTPSSMHNGQRTRSLLLSSAPRSFALSFSAFSPFFFFFFFFVDNVDEDLDMQVSHTSTGTPHV